MARVLLATLLAAAAFPGACKASQLIDRNATGVQLEVSKNGHALVTYHADGRLRHVLAWGAANALAPTPSRPQVAFRLDYSGGWGTFRRDVWKTFSGTCRPYRGP